MKIEEKILSFYTNNCELRKDMTEFDQGYLKALIDIVMRKSDPTQIIEI